MKCITEKAIMTCKCKRCEGEREYIIEEFFNHGIRQITLKMIYESLSKDILKEERAK
jgi:hypothetical protein